MQHQRRRRIGSVQRWMAIGLVLGLGLAAATARAQLQLDAPLVPDRYYLERIEQIEADVAGLIETERTAERPEAMAATARKHLRLIARRLYEVGRDAGADGLLASFYAETLRQRFDAFDEAIGSLPEKVGEALAGDDGARIDRLARAVQGLKRFNQRAEAEAGSLNAADAESIDAYLQRLLSPLLPVAAGLERPTPEATWVSARRLRQLADKNGEAGGGAGGAVTEGDLAALEARLLRTGLPERTRRAFESITGFLRRALGEPDFQPKVRAFVERLDALLSAVERFEGAGWVSEAMRDRLREQVHQILVLMQEPATRSSAVGRLERLAALGRLIDRIGALAALAETPVEPLRQTLRAAHELTASEAGRETADRLIGLLDRLVETASAYRGLGEARLPGDVRRVERLLNQRYAALEGQVLERLPILAEQPEAVTQPRFTEPIEQLDRLAQRLGYLHRIPGWVDRVAAIHPAAGRGVYQQLRQIADDLLDPTLGAGASEALAEMQRQLDLFERLPHEAAFREADSSVRRITGEAHDGMLAQLDQTRQAWANAWATGADPTVPGRRLLLMRRLFEAVHDAARLRRSAKAAERLNRWAGWELPGEVVFTQQLWLPEQLAQGAGQAAAGDFDALGPLLDRVEGEAAVQWLMADLLGRLGPVAGDWPDGLSGLLGQCVYPPTDAAFAADQRQALAEICVLVIAAESSGEREALRTEAARLAEQVREAIKG